MIDKKTTIKVAKLASIGLDNTQIESLQTDLNSIIEWVEQLQEVNTDDVEPMCGAVPITLRMREDKVSDGGYAKEVLANAPKKDGDFFLVPKVVE